MGLINSIAPNADLTFLDAETGEIKSFKEFSTFEKFRIERQKLVFLYLDNSLRSIEIFWGLFRSPHSLVLLNPALNTELKEQIEKQYTPAYIYDATRERIDGFRPIEIDTKISLIIQKCEKSINFSIHPSIKILLSTSGTTGSPKLVKLSEQNIYQNACSIAAYLPINKREVAPLNLPIYYSYGLSVLTSNSIAGGKIVCTKKDILQKEFWADFEKFGYTTIAGVPYVYELLDKIGFRKKEYPSLNYMTQAGGKLNEALVEKYQAFSEEQQFDFFVMYGQTEATARIAFVPPKRLKEKIGSIGQPILNGQLSLEKNTGQLLYQGPNIFGGYATCIEDLATYEEIPVLKTGDIARKDEDGFFYIIGRMKRFTKIMGTRINLDEVENFLKIRFSSNFVCLNMDDKKLFVGTTNQDLKRKEVLLAIRDKLKVHPSFVKFQLMDSLPLTANGKVDYRKITTQIEA